MDLVDIDKVLDDLELNEDEKFTPKPISNPPMENNQIGYKTEGFVCPKTRSSLTNGSPFDDKSKKSIPTQAENPSGQLMTATSSKSYVNISNVFSSLKEYVNVDIDLNKTASTTGLMEPLYPSGGDEENVIVADKESKISKTNHRGAGQESTETENDGDRIKDKVADREDDDDDDEEEIDEDEQNGITSASSITTSSPSSFSSGPTPGTSTSNDSCSLLISGECDGVDGEPVVDGQGEPTMIRDEQLEGATASRTEGISQELRDRDSDENIKELTDSVTAKQFEKEDKISPDIGLSSISSYIYNENTSSSLPGLSNDIIKIDAVSSISSSSIGAVSVPLSSLPVSVTKSNRDGDGYYEDKLKATDDDDDQNVQQKQYEKIDSKNLQDPTSAKHVKEPHNRVIGFGSTMDEISDTELDSILQEIDIDLHPPPTETTPAPIAAKIDDEIAVIRQSSSGNDQPTVQEILVAPDDVIENDEKDTQDEILKTAHTVGHNMIDSDDVVIKSKQRNLSESVVDDDEDQDHNQPNADSFSQASTIEFAELRLQSDFGTDTYTDDKSTSGNSGTKSEVHQQQPPSQEHGSMSAAELASVAAAITSAGIADMVAAPSLDMSTVTAVEPPSAVPFVSQSCQLQRPNSLDLPSLQTNPEININATAGQTPPAPRNHSDQTTLSTSSTEEISNLVEQQQRAGISDGGSINDQHQGDDNLSYQNLGENGSGAEGISVAGSQNNIGGSTNSLLSRNNTQLGKIAPFWIPDSEANACMQCKQKFSLIKRRHHCRACGQVLCSLCCSQKAKLEFMNDGAEVRICVQCHMILSERQHQRGGGSGNSDGTLSVIGDGIENAGVLANRPPNPNNPMEYCSMIPPHQQVIGGEHNSPISVMVPVGVLKREGAPKNLRKDKNVIFSDGIRPGCDLTELDNSWDDNTKIAGGNLAVSGGNSSGGTSSGYRKSTGKRVQTPPAGLSHNSSNTSNVVNSGKKLPSNEEFESFINSEPNGLPPIYKKVKNEIEYIEVKNNQQLIQRLHNETITFAIQRNFFVHVKIAKLKCCINKTVMNFATKGMHHVGQDEIIILLEIDSSTAMIPKDIFYHLNEIYRDADKGQPIAELGFSMPKVQNFLGSREHGGFLYIRSTFQCLQEIIIPEAPFLIGILIHRWEVPWAKIFPLRLMLRLGAQYRYYPSPHVSIPNRDSVYAEIAQTIINFLADFRNYSYTLATIRGMYIHMEDRRTSVMIPKNRYDQVIKALNNSSDHILALGGNFSKKADGHLVCIQNMESGCPETHTYSTQAINIQGQPRKVTGASFLVLNGALKTTSGLSGKCSIVEDGLMVQILPAKMASVRNLLKSMKDIEIICGPIDADETQTEIVSIQWTDNDVEFNIGVKSPIDSKKMDGIPSIRVHSGLNYSNANHIIRWTEVFIIQSDEDSAHGKDPIDMSKLSEQIAKSTSTALVSFLDLLAANGCVKIGLRATLDQENVCYEAGSQNTKLGPIYMNALDNELIPVLHRQTQNLEIDSQIVLELIFHILDK